VASDLRPSLPRIANGGFKRSFLGYKPSEVEAALASAERELVAREAALLGRDARIADLERVCTLLSERLVAWERERREMREELAEARRRTDAWMGSLAALGRRLEEVRAQALGQATRLRMRALRDAAELGRRTAEAASRPGEAGGELVEAMEEMMPRLGKGAEAELRAEEEAARAAVSATANGRPEPPPEPEDLFKGLVHVDVGPLEDLSQLVLFGDAARSIGATSEISIKRFSEGRATMAVQLREPVALLRELEARCDLEFRVRDMRKDRVILDVARDG
jgi:hypothetical protein